MRIYCKVLMRLVRNLTQFQAFQEKWYSLDPDGTGYIDVDDLLSLLLSLGHPLGFEGISQEKIIEEFDKMKVHMTNE